MEKSENNLKEKDRGILVDLDSSPANFSQSEHYILEDEELSEKRLRNITFKIMFKTLFSPVEGWKMLRREHLSTDIIQSECFYPLLALLAAAKFVDFLYKSHLSITHVIVEGLFAFISYFFGYFIILLLLKAILPSKLSEIFNKSFGKSFILISLSTLVLFNLVIELLPMLEPVFIFLPLWTIYSMCKGIRFFKLPEKGFLRFTVLLCISVVGIPLLIEWALMNLIPF